MKKILALILAAVMLLGVPSFAAPVKAEEEVVFHFSRNWEETNADPATFSQVNDIMLASSIYETLVSMNTDGTVSPMLAEDYKISEDGLTYTFFIRKGVKWHGGYGELSAEDVKFTFDRMTDDNVGALVQDYLNYSNIVSVEAADQYTAVITLAQRDDDFISRLGSFAANILCKAFYDEKGIEGMQSTPIGTGAFEFAGGTLGDRTEAVRFADYWQETTGNVDRVICTVIADANTSYQAFDMGEISAIQCYDRDRINQYRAMGYNITMFPVLQLLYAGMNMQTAPFDNEKVREAFFAAIDPQYYIDNLYYGEETTCASYIPAACKYALREDYFSTTTSYDPQRAKELLAEAGYPDGVNITLWSVNDAISPAPATVTQSLLQAAGFNCELQLVEFGTFIDKVMSGEAETWMLYNSTDYLTMDTMVRYTTPYYPGRNWSGIADPEYDALVAEAMASTSTEERMAKFGEAQKRMMDLRVIYPITTSSYAFIMLPNMSGMTVGGDLTPRFDSVVVD